MNATSRSFYLDSKTCRYCDRKFDDNLHRTREHVIPLSRGGKKGYPNTISCCQQCNWRKSNKLPSEWLISDFRGISSALIPTIKANLIGLIRFESDEQYFSKKRLQSGFAW